MFRELLYVTLGLALFAGIILLFRSFDSSSGSLTGFAVREGQQQTTPLTGNAVANTPLDEENSRNITSEDTNTGGASAEFQVGVKVVAP